jgi:2-phospho-L-lactate guanylyltransferase
LDAAARLPPGGPVGVLLPDLPALRPSDLETALAAVDHALTTSARMVAVPDADEDGTVLLAGRRAADLSPAFGAHSLLEHRRRGAAVLTLDLPRLRRDVDTPEDLRAARALGCGPHTRAALAVLDRIGAAARRRPADYPGRVQATVHRFDAASGTGSVLTDEGVVLPFTAEAFARSRLRLLRTGQRVTVTVEGPEQAPLVTELHVPGVGFVPADPARP